ncbi:MAG: carbohydrate ABC transporter permease [Clostridia bacterium]|nr:carbohydrate ABC transporter permease [Clostridia bacterium]
MSNLESLPEKNIKTKKISFENHSDLIFKILKFALLITATVVMLIPVYYLFITALKSGDELKKIPPTLFPLEIHIENFLKVGERVQFGRYYLNSIIVSVLVVIGTVLASSFVGFGFSRYNVKEKKVLFMVLLSTLMLPLPAIIIPQFLLFRNFGWVDSFLPLIVPSFFGSAYMIFLVRQFFSTLPDDLFDAAKIDGCSEIRTWWNIALPLCKPALATIAIFTFLWSWNDYFSAIIYLNSTEHFTLPQGMASMISHYRIVPWNTLMAAAILALLPILLLFFVAQKYFVEGIVLTGIK